jgi:hypothetical protein
MPLRHAVRRAALLLALVASCACAGGGARVADLELIDLPAPAMFEHLAQGLRKAYVLELPPRAIEGAHDLRLTGTTEEAVLRALRRLDPGFQYERREKVLLAWPVGADEKASPFSRTVPRVELEGSVSAVLVDLVKVAGLEASTTLQVDAVGARRPVKLSATDLTVRDALAEIAAQAHLGMRNEPGFLRAFAIAER